MQISYFRQKHAFWRFITMLKAGGLETTVLWFNIGTWSVVTDYLVNRGDIVRMSSSGISTVPDCQRQGHALLHRLTLNNLSWTKNFRIHAPPKSQILVKWYGFVLDGCHQGNAVRITDGPQQVSSCLKCNPKCRSKPSLKLSLKLFPPWLTTVQTFHPIKKRLSHV